MAYDSNPSQLRACVLTTSFPRNATDDAGIFVKRLLEALGAEGVSGTIVVPFDRDEPPVETLAAFTIKRFRYGIFSPGRLCFGAGIVPNIRARPALLLQVPALLLRFAEGLLRDRHGHDVVIANWVSCGFAAWLAAIVTGKPYLIVLRGEDIRLLRMRFLAPFFIPALRSARRLVTVSSELQGELITRFPFVESKCSTILNGTGFESPVKPRETMRERLGIPAAAKVLVSVGTIIPRKRPHLLVQLLAQPGMEEWQLLLIGRTEDQQYVQRLREDIAAHRVGGRVRLVGPVSPDEVPDYLIAADCVASASEFEGRPNAILEALSLRLPVMATDIPAHRLVLEEGALGFLWSETALAAVPARFTQWLAGFDPQRLPALRSWGEAAREYRLLLDELAQGG